MGDQIRMATTADSEEMLNIYAPYILKTAVSFEVEVPSVQDFAWRVESVQGQYPWLVYLADGKIAAFAYANRHRERAAYCYDADASIYAAPEYHGSGIAYTLYDRLFALLKEMGYYNVFAAYTGSNEKSRKFHEKCGFTAVGTFHNAGYKLGAWHDVVYLQKALAQYPNTPGEICPLRKLPKETVLRILKVTE